MARISYPPKQSCARFERLARADGASGRKCWPRASGAGSAARCERNRRQDSTVSYVGGKGGDRMSIECDGLTFSSPEARTHYIHLDAAGRQKWRDERAKPMAAPVISDIVVPQPAPQAKQAERIEPKMD